MKYFDKRFWKETAGFALIIALGIGFLRLFDVLITCPPGDWQCYGPLLSGLLSFVDWIAN